MIEQPPSGDARLLSCLARMVHEGASDLFLTAGAPPTIKRQGVFTPIGSVALSAQDVRAQAYSIMRAAQIEEFESRLECDLAFQTGQADRFRVNVHLQRGQVGMVVRYVSSTIPSLDALGLPPVLKQLAFLKGGLVLAVGAAGSGKSTTQAEAVANADNKTDITLRMRLAAGASLGVEDMQMARDDEDAPPAAPH